MKADNSELESIGVYRQKRLFSFFFDKDIPPIPLEEERKPYPEYDANIISRVFFWWLIPVMKVGYQRTLEVNDLFVLTSEVSVNKMFQTFLSKKCKWSTKLQGKMSTKTIYTLIIFNTFKHEFLLSCIFMALSNIGSSFNPLVSRELITFVERRTSNDATSQGRGVGLAIGTALIVCICGILMNHSFQKSMLVGAKGKAILTKAIVEKSFKLSEKSRHNYPDGRIMSLLGADISRIDTALGYLPNLLTFPIILIIAIVVLLLNIGVSALVGIAILFLYLIFLTWSTSRLVRLRKGINDLTDNRVYYISEVLNNIKMIKLYSWEIPYLDRITKIRNSEMLKIFKVQALRNTILATSISSSNVISMASFLTVYGIKGNIRNSAGIFSSLSLFNILTQVVYVLPVVLAACADAFVAVGRIGEFLECEEIEEIPQDNYIPLNDMEAIKVESGEFFWENFEGTDKLEEVNETFEDKNASDIDISDESDNDDDIKSKFSGLHNINLTIKKGEFIVVTGVIGSGKTSLLNAFSGFMKRKSGLMGINGSLLFCGSPWIQNATIRDNITFGSEFNQERYNKVLSACSLRQDLEILSAGDQTEVGERGITLSGGQKARVNLARAAYANPDIVLMDDVLSAVDAKVGKHIVNHCILELLRDKTRVLATHQLSLIGSADKIIFLNGNGTIDFGPYQELVGRNTSFVKLMSHIQVEKGNDDGDDANTENNSEIQSALKEAKLMQKEDRAVNRISFDIYKSYIRLGSGRWGAFIWISIYLSSTVFATFCQLFSGAWLAFWVEQKFVSRSSSFYIGIYVMFTILTVIFVTGEFICLVSLANNASSKLHVMALKRILHSPMSYIDTTPLGRILNRFSRDTEVLDNEISNQLRLVSYLFSTVAGVLILCVVYLPWFAIAIPVLLFFCVSLSSFYQASSREVKRLEATQRSYVYSSFGEILNGMETLKIYRVQELFSAKFDKMVDQMNEAYFITITNQRFLGVNLTIISSIFSLAIALLCVFSVFNINASSTGLVLSYVIQLTNYLNSLMRSVTQLENQMNSTERLHSYGVKLVQEAPYAVEWTEPKPQWPENGEIVFQNVGLSYRLELPLVLQNLNFKINSNEKIGICGRTGAGKSSITSALFRLVELTKGKIFIDNVDISKIGLSNLRSKLSIIPQDPVLFKGTIRKNLDPFEQSDDKIMIEALKKVGLISSDEYNGIQRNPNLEIKFGLDNKVEDNGVNFSLGEKQLISFARALVRESKILILDEATSSVDYESDRNIQKTIAEDFKDCTILCIAHRLKTILSYDRILVLDNGMVKEFDKPWTLFCQGGDFRKMCEKSNINASDFSLKG